MEAWSEAWSSTKKDRKRRTGYLDKNHYEDTPIQIYRNFHLQKLKIFRYKKSDIFHISAQNRLVGGGGGGGGSNEYPQSMFLSRNKKK